MSQDQNENFGERRDDSTKKWIEDVVDIELETDTIVLYVRSSWIATRDESIQALVRSQLASLPLDQRWNAVINLQATQMVSSSVLGMMLAVWNHVSQTGGRVAVCEVSAEMQGKMERLNLTDVWLIARTQEEALAALANPM